MTLVVSVITEAAVLQASDRRLVWLEADGKYRLRDDNRNKAVMFGKRMVFAYTGLAELGPHRQRTDEWLAVTLNDCRNDQYAGAVLREDAILRSLEKEATARLNHPLYAKLPALQRGHEFNVGLWAHPPSEPEALRPFIAIVSNLRDDTGRVLAEPAATCTTNFAWLQENQAWNLVTSGQHLPDDQTAQLEADISGTGGDLDQLVGVLIEHVRIAASDNKAIGQGVLVNVLPRAAVKAGDDGARVVMGGPIDEVPTCFNVPADSSEAARYGPTVVSPLGGVISDFTAGPLGSFPDLLKALEENSTDL